MVPGKEMEDHFLEVEVGEKYSIQGTVEYDIYNLWGMKEPNYVMRIMATGGRLLTCSIPRCPLCYHSLVCSDNHLFIVGIGPIRDKEL